MKRRNHHRKRTHYRPPSASASGLGFGGLLSHKHCAAATSKSH